MPRASIQPFVKALIGVHPRTPDAVAWRRWKQLISHVCKPCWELKYCPYGPLVEQFPLPRIPREEAVAHNEFLKQQLAKGAYDRDPKRKARFRREVARFRPRDYPEKLSEPEKTMSCAIFGHLCPVFFVNEPFTETTQHRNVGRYIPFKTRIRVARRDNYTCQRCGKHLKDGELEFDHVIPYGLGGPSDEHNIRLTCSECNRSKGKKLG